MKEEEINDICDLCIKKGSEKPALVKTEEGETYCAIHEQLKILGGKYRKKVIEDPFSHVTYTYFCTYDKHSKIYNQIKNNKKNSK